jgi:SAM-dependent methyltransferase
MDALEEYDVPYGNDWDSPTEAAAYGESADQVRPWRSQVRDHIAARVATLAPRARVLELGSGPGLLAQRVFQGSPELETYTLLDFSEAMLALSRERLSGIPAASFVRASFKSDDWPRQVTAASTACFRCKRFTSCGTSDTPSECTGKHTTCSLIAEQS